MMPVGSARRAVNHNITPTEALTWDTSTEWLNAQSQSLATHLQPGGTDWPGTGTVSLVAGLPSDEGGTSLEAYYPGHEDSGTVANDISGNSNDGTYSGVTVGNANGILGFDYPSFDGSNDVLELPDMASIEQITNFSVSMWIYLSETASTHGGNLFPYNVGNDFDNWIRMRIESGDDKLDWQVEEGGTTGTATSTTTISANTWYHICGTFDGSDGSGSGDLVLYVDGSQEGTSGSGPGQTPTHTGEADPEHAIGARLTQSNTGFVPGRIMETRLYSRTVSSAKASTLALTDSPTGFLTTAAKTSSAGLPIQLTTTTTIPANTSVDVVVHQDTNQDGTSDNSETVSLSGGTDETNSLTATNFTEDTDGADYWVDWQPSVTAATDDAPTCSKVAVTIG